MNIDPLKKAFKGLTFVTGVLIIGVFLSEYFQFLS